MLAWTTRQVVVTGAAGWLGFRLVESLLGRSEVALGGVPPLPEDGTIRCLLLPGSAEADELRSLSERVQIVTGDIRSGESCRELCHQGEGGVLLHCAGIIHPRRSREFREVNVEGTANLLGAAVEAKMARAVVVSSNSPMGFNPSRDHLFDEESPYDPYMGYGRSKMLMEQDVRKLQQSGVLEAVIVRTPWFYGPRQPARQTLFFEMIRDGRIPIVGDGENRRSMAYVDNLCQGLLRAALTSDAAGRIYWIADQRPYRMNEIVDTVERLLEQEFGFLCAHRRLRLPNLASGVARLGDGVLQGLGLYSQKLHVLSEMNRDIACSIEAAQKQLGYQPAIALEEGMRRSIRWCIDRGMLSTGERDR